jgi:Zn-dependent peptidase ImmA (M78 family)
VGIYLVEVPAIRNCKVRGTLTTYKGHPAIYISRRFKFHDYVWFAIIHELAHLLLHYSPKETFVAVDDLASDDDKDRAANEYARDFFVAPDAYDAFIAEGGYDPGSVRRFAKAQGTTAGMVAAFLQHDGKIDYSELSGLRM